MTNSCLLIVSGILNNANTLFPSATVGDAVGKAVGIVVGTAVGMKVG